LNEVVLSGGVWQNQILLDLVWAGLREDDFLVYRHKQVPTNDGGLALGQAMVANFTGAERSELVSERSAALTGEVSLWRHGDVPKGRSAH
jgi:hydrogenase maturation protein HypF